jgi:DNA-binding transcriptional MerR regulator
LPDLDRRALRGENVSVQEIWELIEERSSNNASMKTQSSAIQRAKEEQPHERHRLRMENQRATMSQGPVKDRIQGILLKIFSSQRDKNACVSLISQAMEVTTC